MHAILKHEGVHVGRKRVERLMRPAGLTGISPAGARASLAVTRTLILLLTWCNASSPRTGRTGCGSLTTP
ncbi:IS3 family transposase [Streptomyces sp. NPDC017260]|uniref:IS3 family transposase n=1 Tax=unclassified Streptomyces TaxID=2593676 RepID=UPI003795D445